MNFVPLDLYKQYRLRKRAVHENWVPPNSFSYNSIWRNTKEFFIFYFIFLHSLKKIKLSTSHSFSIAYFSISVFLKTPPVHTGRPFFAWEGGLVPGGVRQAQALGRPAAAPRTLGVPEYQQQILQVHEAEEELRAVSLPPGQMECPRGPQFVHCHSRAWKGETCKRNGAKDRPGGAISSLHDCRSLLFHVWVISFSLYSSTKGLCGFSIQLFIFEGRLGILQPCAGQGTLTTACPSEEEPDFGHSLSYPGGYLQPTYQIICLPMGNSTSHFLKTDFLLCGCRGKLHSVQTTLS